MLLTALSAYRGRLLLVYLCSFFFGFAAVATAIAQDEGTQSVADAARAARANRAQSSNSGSTKPSKHSPFSQTQLLAWQIAGVPTSDLLNELKANGIAFQPDEAHLARLKEAKLPEGLVSVLATVPSHPESTDSVMQALIAASEAFHSKDYATARRALEPLVQQTPSADLYAAFGNVQFLSNDVESAKKAFERAVQLDPSFVYAHVRLAGIYYSLENGAQAGAEAKKALQLQPGNAEARKYVALSMSMKLEGSASFGVSNSDDDVGDLSDLETKGSDNQEAKDLNNQGIALMEQHEWQQAEAAYKGAIKLDPKVPLFYYNLGVLYRKWGGHNVLQRAAYEQAKALAPHNLAILQNYGAELCREHAYDEAIKDFREILRLDPSWNMARPCLYQALYNSGKRGEAAQVLSDYRDWNHKNGVPDDSDEIDLTKVPGGPSL